MPTGSPADLRSCASANERRPRRGGRAGPRRALGRAAVRPRHDASGRTTRRVQAAIAERLGWLDAPEHFSRAHPRPRGLRATASARPASATRSSWAWAAAASRRRSSHGRSASARRASRPARPRLDRSGRGRRHVRRARSARDAVDRRLEVRHDDRAARLPGRGLGAGRRGARGRGLATAAGRVHGRDHRPGKSVEAIPHHDELREAFLNPPDIGGRYSALTYVGLVPAALHRPRPRRPPRATPRTMLHRCREPDPTAQPGRPPGPGDGRARPRRAATSSPSSPTRRSSASARGPSS